MERKRFLAVVMTVMMVISMIPSMVFAAAPSGELGGKLKIKGLAAVGVVLSADYAKVTPEEVTDEDFTFSWSRQTGEKELTQVGTEKTYTITQDDLTKVSRQLDVSMGDMFQVINVFAIVMFALLVYLLTKLIIEKNTISISMVKILGYDNREIGKLYLTATTWVVVCSIAVSIPLSYLLIELIYRSMMADFHGWLMMYVAPKVYGEMFVLGLIVYFVVAFFQMARIRKIPMDEALKNVE